ncbi:MAG: sialidase family protein [Thermoplasmatota archaeon]
MEARIRCVLIAGLALLAGCVAPAPAAFPGKEAPATLPSSPATATDRWMAPVALGPATNGAEPVADAIGDMVYVTTPLHLWRSADGGSSFTTLGTPGCDPPEGIALPTCPPPFQTTVAGVDGVNDGFLTHDANGTLLWLGQTGAGQDLPYQRSATNGSNWTAPLDLAPKVARDRPWLLSITPSILLATFADTQAGQTDAITSADGGAHWTGPVKVAESAIEGRPAWDPIRHRVYVPISNAGSMQGERVASSDDLGKTWRVSNVTSVQGPVGVGVYEGSPTDDLPLAVVDPSGNLFIVWSFAPDEATTANLKLLDQGEVQYAYSTDGGKTFSRPIVLSPPGESGVLPWAVVNDTGSLFVAWYGSQTPLPNDQFPNLWSVEMAAVDHPAGPSAHVRDVTVTPGPVHVGPICTMGAACPVAPVDRRQLDFLSIILLPSGSLGIAYAADNPSCAGALVEFVRSQ